MGRVTEELACLGGGGNAIGGETSLLISYGTSRTGYSHGGQSGHALLRGSLVTKSGVIE